MCLAIPSRIITKRFIQSVIPDTIPDTIVQEIRAQKENYKIIKVRFLGKKANDNVLYHINKTYPVTTNVLFASVSELQKTVLGIFILQIVGDDASIQQVMDYINSKDLQWQEVEI